jgi:hypothetical protein
VTPADARPEADEIGAPTLPLLCDDHLPVIHAAAEKEHLGDGDVRRAAESKAVQCPDCYALNGRTLL